MFSIGRREALDEVHGNVIPNLARNRKWLKEPYGGQGLGFGSLTNLTNGNIVLYCVIHGRLVKLLG